MAGIVRITGVSEQWLQTRCQYFVHIYPQERRSLAQKKGQLTIEYDQMRRFFPCLGTLAVGKKSGKTNLTNAMQLYFQAKNFTSSQKNFVLLKKVTKPHWSYLVFHRSLQ